MADLFDVSVGGTGFHLTSHLIALAALFVACFAITGYISFRGNSIPGKALKDHDADFEQVQLDGITWGDKGGAGSGRMVEKHIHAYFSGALTSGTARYMVKSITDDQSLANRVVFPAGHGVTKATILAVTSCVRANANATLNIGLQAATLAAAGNTTSLFSAADLSNGNTTIPAGSELIVVGADTDGFALQSAGVATSTLNPTVDQHITINSNNNNLTSGTYRLDIWYMDRE